MASEFIQQARVRRGRGWYRDHGRAAIEPAGLRIELQGRALAEAQLTLDDVVVVRALQPGALLVVRVGRGEAVAQARARDYQQRWANRRARAARFGLSPQRYRKDVAALTSPARPHEMAALGRGPR